MKSLEEKFEKDSIRFIDRLYRDLYLSEDVLRHSTHHRTDKFNNIPAEMDIYILKEIVLPSKLLCIYNQKMYPQ